MIFSETKLRGAFVVDIERLEDERGFFALSWSEQDFAAQGLESQFVQCNVSFNRASGTLRGMHYQQSPHGQVKLVRCTRGAIFDVMIDLRPTSPTFRQWFGIELTAENHRALYIPKDFAHGFQSLESNSEVLYQMSNHYVPGSARGVRWDDPAFNIAWPSAAHIINVRDREYPDFPA